MKMDSLFFIKRYMGSDDEDDGGDNQQVNASKGIRRKNNLHETDSVIEIDDSDSLNNVGNVNYRNSNAYDFADSQTKSQKKGGRKSKVGKYLQIPNEENLEKCKLSDFKDCDNVSRNLNSSTEMNNEIEILNDLDCANPIKYSRNKSSDISNKSRKKELEGKCPKMLDNLRSYLDEDNDTQILDDLDTSNFVHNTKNECCNFNEKEIKKNESSEMKSRKRKKQKVTDIQILQCSEENRQQNSNLLSFQNSKVIKKNSCSFIEDTSKISQNDVTGFESRKAKKQKTENIQHKKINEECKSGATDLEDTEAMNQRVASDKKKKVKSPKQYDKEYNADSSKSESRHTLPDWPENANYKNSDACDFVDSQTKSQEKKGRKSKVGKHLQIPNEENLDKCKFSDFKDQDNVSRNLNSPIEMNNEIEILNDVDCVNPVTHSINESSNINEKREKLKLELLSKLEDKLRSFIDEGNDTKILNHLNGSMEDQKVVSDEKKKIKSPKQYHKEYNINSSNSENKVGAFHTIGQVQHQKDINCRQTLPDWLSNPTYIDLKAEKTAISELKDLDSVFKKNLKKSNINFLFPVQSTVMPLLWKNYVSSRRKMIPPSDICICAPTGSGKTLAFVLPIVQALKERVVNAIRALVVIPVSELAIQVYKVFKSVTRGTDLQVALLTGQKSFCEEQKKLVRKVTFQGPNQPPVHSLVDIVVATPGRIRDHMYRTEGFCLRYLRYLVIDEADRLMEEIQRGWLKKIEDSVFKDSHSNKCLCSGRPITRMKSSEKTCPKTYLRINEPLQKLLCSATLTHDPEKLNAFSLYRPKLFTASTSDSEQKFTGHCIIPDTLTTLKVICKEDMKPMIISHLIKQRNFKRVLCFTESVDRAHKLNLLLEAMGLQVREITSLKKAVQRKIVLKQFACGRVNALVCSDLLSRGIDILNVDCVISYDVPQCDKMYVHRIGRTARAGKSGIAITLLSEGEIPHFEKILKLSELKIPDTVNIQLEDLKPLLKTYKKALSTVDTKLKSKNHDRFRKKDRGMKKTMK